MSITYNNSKSTRNLIRETELQLKRFKHMNKDLETHISALNNNYQEHDQAQLYINK